MRTGFAGTAIHTSTLQDCAVIAIAVVLTSALYVPTLGFYSDDWSFLRTFAFSSDQSLSGLIRSFFEADANTRARPLQALYLAALFQLFDLNPLGYHVVNTLVFVGGLCAFYLALRSLSESRLFSIAVVLVYGTLPHYSTDRFWYAAFQANLSMLFYFVSLYCCLRQLTAVRPMYAVWTVGAALCLIASVLAYEVFAPFFLLNCLIVGIKQWQLVRLSRAPSPRAGDLVSLYLGPPLLIALTLSFKNSVSTRGGSPHWAVLSDAFPAAVELTVGAYGAKLPHILNTIFRNYLDWSIVGTTLIAAIGIWFGLRHVARHDRAPFPARLALVLTLVGSAVVAGLSYAYFFSYFKVDTGINNRVTNAAAVCVALFLVAGLSLAISLLPLRLHRAGFCFAIAAVCGCGSLITNSVATFWVEASRAQAEIMQGLKAAWRSPPPGSSVLLTGYCSWIGPGIVFETDWDVTGAVGLLYRDRTLAGNVLRPWMNPGKDGLRTGDFFYSFASLYVYDARTGLVHRVADEATASRFLRALVAEDVSGCAGNYKAFGAGLPIW